MADTLLETEAQAGAGSETEALALGIVLEEHKGADVIVIDLRPMNTWTDFFVIATASSGTHLDGLERHVKEFIAGKELEIIRRSSRPASQDDEWRILDMGTIVIHLMSGRTRSFYELERLYAPPHAAVIYSSKSS